MSGDKGVVHSKGIYGVSFMSGCNVLAISNFVRERGAVDKGCRIHEQQGM